MRVPQFLSEQEVHFESIVHPPAFSADKRGRLLHVAGKNLAKSVLLYGPHGYLLAVVPATHQVDLGILGQLFDGPVRLASNEEIAFIFRDCEWGTLVPFGSLYDVPTFLDDSFDPEAVMHFEAQRHAHTIRMRCRDFERLERPRRLQFGQRKLPAPHLAGRETVAE